MAVFAGRGEGYGAFRLDDMFKEGLDGYFAIGGRLVAALAGREEGYRAIGWQF